MSKMLMNNNNMEMDNNNNTNDNANVWYFYYDGIYEIYIYSDNKFIIRLKYNLRSKLNMITLTLIK